MSEPSTKPSPFENRPAQLLTGRLRELGITASGLPEQVVAHLKGVIKTEADAIQVELDAEIAEANKRAGERLVKRIAARLSYKSIGKSFGKLRGADAKSERISSQVSATSIAGGGS